MSTTEKAFEDAIELKLLSQGGYLLSSTGDFDKVLGLNLVELYDFIHTTQPKAMTLPQRLASQNALLQRSTCAALSTCCATQSLTMA